MKWLVIWLVDGVEKREEFVYEYNARQWVHVVRLWWGVEATVREVTSSERDHGVAEARSPVEAVVGVRLPVVPA